MRLLPLLALLALPLTLSAQASTPSLQSLVGNSPFGVANQGGPGVQTASGAPLEFRGTFVDGGERFFSIVDTATRRAEWVGMNETDRPFVVRNFDVEQETIAIEHQGRTLNLKLHSAKVGVLPPMQTAAQPAAQPGNANNAAAANAAPSTGEAQRLAQVAEEIRRRRALRQQAANPQNAQPQGQPAPQPPRQP